MTARVIGRSTKTERGGRISLPVVLRRRASPKAGPVEFRRNDAGDWIVKSAVSNKREQKSRD